MKKNLLLNSLKQPVRLITGSVKPTEAGLFKLLFIVIVFLLNGGNASALPSFARQTGMACTACHNSFPELTPFGRLFKLNGYTLATMTSIDATNDSSQVSRLKLLTVLPLSVMLQTSFTKMAKDVEGVQNNSVAFPQQLSMFYAGQITPHIGTFIQVTYDGQSIGMDNADLRYANQVAIGTKSLLYGLTLNNNPTVQDVWNTTPAWRFPSASSESALSPTKSTIIENLGMQVAGLGAYTLYNNLLFAELSFYRSAQQGAANPADSTTALAIKGAAPYWRLALQHQWSNTYLEVGTFGIAPQQYVNGVSGNMDNFTDLGFDLQLEHNLSFGHLSLHSSLINETEHRDLSAMEHSNLNFNSFKIDGSMYFNKGLGGTIGYFNTSGSEDPNVGSYTGKPNSSGMLFQLEYLPWYNTKFILQYVSYAKFDGSSNNYDSMGRNAPNNNTLYLMAWFNF
jgi:hypothetical protein